MEYHATFKDNFIGVVLIVPVCGLLIWIGASSSDIVPVILGTGPLLLFLAILLRLRVVIADDNLEYRGLVSTKRIRFSDVTRCCPISTMGYFYESFYGPFVYWIKTPDETLKINFKFFPLECMNTVLAKIPKEDEYDE